MKEKLAENDAFVAYLSNPNAETRDYILSGLTSDNTQLLKKSEYEELPFFKKAFTDQEGVFNQKAFDDAYAAASDKYFEMADEKAFQNALEWNPGGRYVPEDANIRDVNSFEVNRVKNSNKTSLGLTGFNQEGPQIKTEEELAQMGKIWDSENKMWKEGTAETQSIIEKFFGNTLVYAKYTQDGVQENPVTGEIDMHYKGEFMTDENGNYFTRTISDEELGNNQVVALADILTKEDSALNVIDFFDSDGFEKSAWGTTAKILTTSLLYFIPATAPYYGALTAALGLASVMPTFLKAIDSIFTGNQQTEVKGTLREMENWFRKYNSSSSVSRHSRESFLTYENIGNLLSDVFGQIHQQRAAASLAKYIKPIHNNTTDLVGSIIDAQKKQNRIGQSFSLGYMSLISAANVFDDAKRGGYDDRTAGATALLSAASLFGIMNFNSTARGIGTWFLDKTTGYNENVSVKPLLKLFRQSYDEMANVIHGKFSPETVNGAFGNLWMKIKESLFKTFVQQGGGIWQRAMLEGIEEVSEEVVQDTVKGITDFLSWSGFISKGSFGGFSNVFSREGAARYMQTLLGGALGGAIFEFQQNHYQPWVMRTFKDPNYKSDFEKQAEKDIFDVIINGQGEQFEKAARSYQRVLNDRRRNIGYVNEKGVFESLMAEGENSEAQTITNDIIRQYKYMEAFVKGITGVSDFSKLNLFQQEAIKNWLEPQKQQILDYSKEAFKRDINNAWEAYTSWKAKEFNNAENNDVASSKNASELKTRFKEQSQKVRDLFSGESAARRLQEIQVFMDSNIRELALLPFETWYDLMYKDLNVSFNDLPEGDKNTDSTDSLTQTAIKAKYQAYSRLHTDGIGDPQTAVNIVPDIVDLSLQLNKNLSRPLQEWVESELFKKNAWRQTVENYQIDDIVNDYIEDNFDEEAFKKNLDEKLSEEQKDLSVKAAKNSIRGGLLSTLRSGKITDLAKITPQAFTLNDRLKIDLASVIDEALDYDNFSDASKKVIRQMINTAAVFSGLTSFNKESVQQIINSVNQSFTDENNIYAKRIAEIENKSDDENDSSIIDVKGITSTLTLDQNKLDANKLLSLKYDNLKELSDATVFISPELAKIIRNQVSTDLFMQLKAISADVFLISDSEAFSRIKSFINSTDYVDETGLDEGNSVFLYDLCQSAEVSEDYFLDVLQSETIKSVVKNAAKLFDKISESTLSENPLTTALKSIYFKFKGSNEGDTIFEKLIEMQDRLNNSDFTADTMMFTEEERSGIMDAFKTLRVINAVLGQMYVGEENPNLFVHPKGLNQIQVDYLNAYHNGKGAEKFIVLSHDDYQSASNYIAELGYKLEMLSQIDSELNKTKSEFYNKIRIDRNNNLACLYKSDILKHISFDDREIDLLSGYEYDNDLSVEENNLNAEIIIHKNLRKLSETVDLESPESVEQFLSNLYKGLSNIEGIEFKEGAKTWDASFLIGMGENIEKINGITLFQHLTRLWLQQPALSFSYLKSVCDVDENFSPRVDQEEALLNIFFALDNYVAANAMLNVIHNNLEQQENYPNKLLLNNVMLLVGTGGSGKTLLAKLINKDSTFKDKLLFTAKNESNVDGVKESFNVSKTLNELFSSFKNTNSGWKDIEQKIINKIKSEAKDAKDAIQVTENIDIDGIKGTVTCTSDSNHEYIEKYDFNITSGLNSTIDVSDIVALTVVDECTQLNPLQQALLSKWAKDNKKWILELGDPIQPGYSALTTSDINTTVDLVTYRAFITGNLEGMWRAENSAIQELVTQLYSIYTHDNSLHPAIFSFSEDKVFGPNDDNTKRVIDSVKMLKPVYTDSNKSSKYTVLGYHIAEETNDLMTTFDKINAIEDVSKVVIVPDETTAEQIEEFKKQFNTWDVIKLSDAQGQQYDYVLVDGFNSEKYGIVTSSKNLFMLLSRPKRGLLMGLDQNKAFKNTGIQTSIKSNSIKEFVSDTRDQSAKQRVEEINYFADNLETVKIEPVKVEIKSEKPVVEQNNNSEDEQNFQKNWDVYGEQVLQIEQWYTRLGVDYDKLNDDLKTQTSYDGKLQTIIDAQSTKNRDLVGFATLLKNNSNLVTEFKPDFDFQLDDFIRQYVAFKNNLSLKLQSDNNSRIFIEYCPTNIATSSQEKPYEKFNNFSHSAPLWRMGIVFKENNVDYYFTLGSFSYDTQEKLLGELIIDKYWKRGRNGSVKVPTKATIYEFQFDGTDVDNVKFHDQFKHGSEAKYLKSVSKTPVTYSSGVQVKQFKLDPNGIGGLHTTVGALLKSGWEIVEDGTGKKVHNFDSKNAAFNWLNKYNFEQAEKNLLWADKTKWVLLRRIGTNEMYPILIQASVDLSSIIADDNSYIDARDGKAMQKYTIQQLTKGLLYAMDLNYKEVKFSEIGTDGKQYTITKIVPIDEKNKIIDLKQLKSKLDGFCEENNLTANQKALYKLLEYHSVIKGKGKKVSENSKDETFKIQKDLADVRKSLRVVFEQLEKEIKNKDFTLKGYSFSNKINDINSKSNLTELVVSKIVEAPKLLINFQNLTSVEKNNSANTKNKIIKYSDHVLSKGYQFLNDENQICEITNLTENGFEYKNTVTNQQVSIVDNAERSQENEILNRTNNTAAVTDEGNKSWEDFQTAYEDVVPLLLSNINILDTILGYIDYELNSVLWAHVTEAITEFQSLHQKYTQDFEKYLKSKINQSAMEKSRNYVQGLLGAGAEFDNNLLSENLNSKTDEDTNEDNCDIPF